MKKIRATEFIIIFFLALLTVIVTALSGCSSPALPGTEETYANGLRPQGTDTSGAAAKNEDTEDSYTDSHDTEKQDAVTTSQGQEEPEYPDIVFDTEVIAGEPGEPMRINWNPYKLPALFSEAGEEYGEGALDFIKALINHRNTVSFSSLEVMKAVEDNIFAGFPLSALASVTFDAESLSAVFDYRYQRDEHLRKVTEFKERVESIIAETLLFGDDECIAALLLYHWISSEVDYFTHAYEQWQTNAYYALMNGESICYGFAEAYSYLLLQVGIRAEVLFLESRSDGAEHAWCVITVDGKSYHCDPTWESSVCSGAGFSYFGLTDQDRNDVFALESAHYGNGALSSLYSYICGDDRFAALNFPIFSDDSWTLDRENYIVTYSGKRYAFPPSRSKT